MTLSFQLLQVAVQDGRRVTEWRNSFRCDVTRDRVHGSLGSLVNRDTFPRQDPHLKPEQPSEIW